MRKKLQTAVLTVALGLLTLVLTAGQALASTPYWANTHNDTASNGLTVYWCAGGSGVLAAGQTTTKNICGILLRDNRYLYVYVKETGTVLFDRTNCTGDKRVNFTTSTDTSRTAMVLYFSADSCV
jgi:hypothetical protein